MNIQTCQVLKNFMREGNFLRLVSRGRNHSWRALGEILKFEFPRSPENELPFQGFSSAFFEAQTLCVHAIKYEMLALLVPKRQKIALLRLRSLPAFCLFLICD
jgi:hypothetical protein